MKIVESRLFTKYVGDYLTEKEYSAFRYYLAQHPEHGDLIPGGGGIRKIRWGAKGRGKRSGVRIIYFHYVTDNQILLMLIYGKNEMTNISTDMLKRLRKELPK